MINDLLKKYALLTLALYQIQLISHVPFYSRSLYQFSYTGEIVFLLLRLELNSIDIFRNKKTFLDLTYQMYEICASLMSRAHEWVISQRIRRSVYYFHTYRSHMFVRRNIFRKVYDPTLSDEVF